MVLAAPVVTSSLLGGDIDQSRCSIWCWKDCVGFQFSLLWLWIWPRSRILVRRDQGLKIRTLRSLKFHICHRPPWIAKNMKQSKAKTCNGVVHPLSMTKHAKLSKMQLFYAAASVRHLCLHKKRKEAKSSNSGNWGVFIWALILVVQFSVFCWMSAVPSSKTRERWQLWKLFLFLNSKFGFSNIFPRLFVWVKYDPPALQIDHLPHSLRL